jgi:hypothetical protein
LIGAERLSVVCRKRICCIGHTTRQKEHRMLDVILIALGLGFFVASIAYTYACDRL